MEFVGRTVRKEFKGFGVFTGVVKSFDSASGFFKIGYDDGDSEEIDLSELTALVEFDGVCSDPSRVGSRPKKKPRVPVSSNSGNENEICSSVGNVVASVDSNLDSVDAGVGNDLNNNEKVNVNDEGIDLNLELIEENDLESKGEDLVEDYTVKKQQFLDLNMDLNDDENNNQDVDLGGSCDIATRRPVVLGIQSCINDQTENIDRRESLAKTHTSEKKRGRKRKSLADIPKTPTERVLRRSARRRSMFSGDDHDGNAIKLDDDDDDSECALPFLSSPVISAVSEDQPTSSECKESEELNIVLPKIELPPSTGSLNLDDLPVLDVFSVYAFLRSFSTILYLSPFELADFVASLRSSSPSLLIDCIHVSLLRTLRKLLEFQSSESSTSATNCLRDLNWDLLDLVTWPIYMAGYLLMKPGFDLAELKNFKTDYHKQPGSVKIKMLQYICDDVIEMEGISSELNRRILGDPTNLMDPDFNTKLTASKKRKTTSGSSCMSEEVINESVDRNSDECCLCNMDGNLICCDGCPAAYHSKCVGIATSLLPDGNWYCPECVVDKKSLYVNVAKAIRGAELLGADTHGRLYYSTCGYILVSDPGDAETETSYHYYHMNDITALIDTLKLPNGPYEDISDAITKHWHLYNKIQVEKTELDSEKPVEVDRTATRKNMPQQLENSYLNFYTFARVASSVAEEWARKLPDNKSTIQAPTKTLEELISIQMKAITKIPVDFFWSNIQNLSVDARKEKCGWCMACKFPTDDGICLFYMNNGYVLENYTSQVLGFDSRIISRNERLLDVMCHILYIEDRLRGLLLGPWLNPHFPKLYRKRFHETSDIAPVKDLLLMLESNIWSRALSDEWIKHVDSVATMGSASHVVTSKLRLPSTRNVIGKKRSKSSDPEPHSSKNAQSGVGLFWWRGGTLTRRLFNWKVLPCSLARKAARQGGGTKINGILYPENSDFPKRSKVLVWRAAVQSAVTVEQLALQIRELDAHIKWEEIENSSHLAKMDKESLKSMRSFKKAIIRRKSSEGGGVKYLLDFGKRRFIPDMVVKHGSKVDDSASSERKKYWVQEPFVPLFLLKPFEDKRIALKSNKTSSSVSFPVSTRNRSKKDVFDYLLKRAEKPENHPCGHCNKEVLIRDAISCQYCEGLFHKRHVKKVPGGAYTCIKCHAGDTVKAAGPKKGKLGTRKTKKVTKTTKKGGKGKQSSQTQANSKSFVVPLRRSARTAKIVSLQSKKKPVKKKKKQSKSGGSKKKQLNSLYEIEKPKGKRGRPKKVIMVSYKRRRSPAVNSIYWLNGLLLSRKPDDERVDDFRSKNRIQLSDSVPEVPPKCSICHEPEFKSWLMYICCDSCKDWFHGDAFGLKDEHTGVIIGFKCHKCRERPAPICPHLNSIGEKPESSKPKSEEGIQYATVDVASETVLMEKKPVDAEPVSGSEVDPEQNGPVPVFEEDPVQIGPVPGSEKDPGQNEPMPVSEEDPVQIGPVPGSEKDPGQNGPVPGSEEDLGQNGPVTLSVVDPGQNGPVPVSEEDLGQNGPVSLSVVDPGKNGPVLVSEIDPGQNRPVSEEDLGKNVPVPVSDEDPGQNGPVPGSEENGPVSGFEHDSGPAVALPLVEENGCLKANTSPVD